MIKFVPRSACIQLAPYRHAAHIHAEYQRHDNYRRTPIGGRAIRMKEHSRQNIQHGAITVAGGHRAITVMAVR